MTDKSSCLVCNEESSLIKRLPKEEVIKYSGGNVPSEMLREYGIHKCGSCELEFSAPMPSKEVLDSYYGKYSDPRARSDVVKANAEKTWLI